MSQPLSDLNILVLEDEFLIAMDVEQICRDHGAQDVTIVQNLGHLPEDEVLGAFDAAVVDLMLNGRSTLEVASRMRESGVPIVFASGYTDMQEILSDFPETPLVSKPYAGADLVEAIASAVARRSSRV